MSQTKKGSITETLTNTVIGFVINYVANILVLPIFGFHPSARQTALIGVIFTAISIVRGYVLRRLFNRMKLFQA